MAVDQQKVKDYVPVHELQEIKDGNPGLSAEDIVLVSQRDENIVGGYVSRHAKIGTVAATISELVGIGDTNDAVSTVSAGLDAVSAAAAQALGDVEDAKHELCAYVDDRLTGYVGYGDEKTHDIGEGQYIRSITQNGDRTIGTIETAPISALIVEQDKLAPGVLCGQVLTSRTYEIESAADSVSYTMLSSSYLAINAELHEDEDSNGPVCISVDGTLVSRSDDGWESAGQHVRYMSERFPLAEGVIVTVAYENGKPIPAGSRIEFTEFALNPSDFVGLEKIYEYKLKEQPGVQSSTGIYRTQFNRYGLAVKTEPLCAATESEDGLLSKEDKAKLNRYPESGYKSGNHVTVSDDGVISHAEIGNGGTAGSKSSAPSNQIQIPYVEYDKFGHVTGSGTATHTIPTATAGKDGLMSSQDKSKLDMLSTFNELKREMFDAIYPVGSIYITVSKDFDPSKQFNGNWEELSEGYSLVTFKDGAGGAGIPAMPDPGSYLSAVLPKHNHVLKTIGWSSTAGTTSTSNNTEKMGAARATTKDSKYVEYECMEYSSLLSCTATTDPLSAVTINNAIDYIQSDVYSGTGVYVRPTGISVKVWKRTS